MDEKKGRRSARPADRKKILADPDQGRVDTTVKKAITLFEFLAASDIPLGVSALSKHFNLQKSNVHRLLNTLSILGYVRQDIETKRYLPTLRVWEVGSDIVQRDALRVAARPILKELYQATGRSVFISVLSGTHILYLDTIDFLESPQLGPQSGGRVPAAYPASGKAILAHQSDPASALERVIAAFPQAVDLDRAALLKEFKTIREQGYAVTVNGWRKGSSSLAAPILTPGYPANAAIGVAGVSEQLPQRQILKFAQTVMTAARRISELRVRASVTSWEQ